MARSRSPRKDVLLRMARSRSPRKDVWAKSQSTPLLLEALRADWSIEKSSGDFKLVSVGDTITVCIEVFDEKHFKLSDINCVKNFCGGLTVTDGYLSFWEEFDSQLGQISLSMWLETKDSRTWSADKIPVGVGVISASVKGLRERGHAGQARQAASVKSLASVCIVAAV